MPSRSPSGDADPVLLALLAIVQVVGGQRLIVRKQGELLLVYKALLRAILVAANDHTRGFQLGGVNTAGRDRLPGYIDVAI